MRHTRIAVAADGSARHPTLAACGSSSSSRDHERSRRDQLVARGLHPRQRPGRSSTSPPRTRTSPRSSPRCKAAGLAETLSGTGPFTVFAPTNEAFAKLPAGLRRQAPAPGEQGRARQDPDLPRRRVEGDGRRREGREGRTVEGGEITLSTDGGVKVTTPSVTAADVAASNGVIHVIDTVLVPADVDVSKL